MALWKFSQHRTIWGWTFQNVSPTVFIWCQTNFMRTLATMVEYRVSLFFAISQVLKILWHFEILTCESMGNLKCEISRKWLIIERNRWKSGTQTTTVHICRVLLMLDLWMIFECCDLLLTQNAADFLFLAFTVGDKPVLKYWNMWNPFNMTKGENPNLMPQTKQIGRLHLFIDLNIKAACRQYIRYLLKCVANKNQSTQLWLMTNYDWSSRQFIHMGN